MVAADDTIFYDGPPQPTAAVKVPATMGNVGAGFDVLGLALDWFTYLHVRCVESGLRIINEGEGAQRLPTDETHLVFRALERLFAHAGQPVPGLELRADNRLPLARGLGSSAAAVVAGLAAGAVLAGGSWSRTDLYRLAVPLEGHPDNVGPAIFGGLTINVAIDRTDGDACALATPVLLPSLSQLRLVVVVPELELPTRQARQVLPEQVPHGDAVANVAATAMTVAAFATGEPQLLRQGLADRLHEPYRARLIPGFAGVVQAARSAGALGTVLSGAGPTITAFFTDEDASQRLEDAGRDMVAAFAAAGCDAVARTLRLSDAGVTRVDAG